MKQANQKTNKLRFLHRVALICNVFFLVCLMIRFTHVDAVIPQPLVEIAALLGWIFSPVINVICIVASLIVVLKKGKGLQIPLWLIAFNFFFFGFEIFYFFIS